MCDCKFDLAKKMEEKLNFEKAVPQYEMFSGKTYTDFTVTETEKKKEKKVPVLHTYCPFCGVKYD